MSAAPPRVAFFTDCFHEVNGVALTSRQLHGFASRRGFPFFSAHAGTANIVTNEATMTTLEFQRSRWSVPLDAGMAFDPFWARHLRRIHRVLEPFAPDLIHITGPGDAGLLGLTLARQLRVPLVASWHTNLHEFGARRLEQALRRVLPARWAATLGRFAERQIFHALQWFYRFGRVLLAPNPELIEMLERTTHRPVFPMGRGVDTHLFHPAKRTRTDDVFTIGYAGRLSPEKNVQELASIEQALLARGHQRFRFLIVGQGSERAWLQQHLRQAEFTGVLRGEPLARAYANMDVFAFPSRTDTFGNVIQEALASGVPAVVTDEGGPKYLIQEGTTGFVAQNVEEFADAIERLLLLPEQKAKMVRAAREHALQISWDAVFETVYRAYHTAAFSQTPEATPLASIITTDAFGTRR